MKLNILVTSGGTTENIDTVRSISNMSSGKLGGIIAGKFADETDVEKIFYLCGKNSFIPQAEKLEIVCVDSVLSLENAVKEVIGKAGADIIIHSMAVSDYRVKSITSTANIVDLVFSNLNLLKGLGEQEAKTALASLIGKSAPVVHGDGKISSNVDDMILFMERTPKIISLFQTLSPKSTLVGFKLLDNVPREILIDKGFQVLTQNKCGFVLANDLREIEGERHIGYLIDKDKNYTRYETKAEIADAIVSATMREKGRRI